MAYIYVRSTDGNDSDNGSTWALAKATISGACSAAAAGDIICVSSAHSETLAGSRTHNPPQSTSASCAILSVNDGAAPPTALAAGAVTEATSSFGSLTIGRGYWHGFTFKVGTGSEMYLNLNLSGAQNYKAVYESCKFQINATGSENTITLGDPASLTRLINCTVKFAAATNKLTVAGKGRIHWTGGGFEAGTTSPSYLFADTYGNNTDVLIEDCDFSAGSSSMGIVANPAGSTRITFRNCRFPSSFSYPDNNGYASLDYRISFYGCSDGTTVNQLRINDANGIISQEATLVRTGGASDGTNSIAWKLVGNANLNWTRRLYTDEIVVWNDTTGASKTATVEILHDSATNLKDDEVWLEVEYLGSSSYTQATHATDCKADFLATAADQTTSSTTWTTTGMSNPNKQKLSVTFTPQAKGFILARVVLAKASKTIYVDPMITIT